MTDVLDEYLPPVADLNTGSLYGDLRAFVENLATVWAAPWIDGLTGLLADLRHDPEADAAYRSMIQRRDQPLVNAIARAVRRGEIREVPELALVGNVLEGPLMHRRVVGRQAVTPEFFDAVALSAHCLITGTTVLR
ncbi:TetR-like C-terminal domain-containing protein [Lentzea flava]|uniref:TetR-like C-terminal domain-containing protein n=1 Tax=Lentzea flava TaxID=103732 RepID=UPI001E2B0132|nr:TetR-like C-terminal domain-containing protein [Lentzea flava]